MRTRSLMVAAAPLLCVFALQQLGGALLIHAKAGLAPLLLERAWKVALAEGGRAVKPWPWADTWPVARLSVPSLGVSQVVLAGDSGNALAFGPGHKSASAAPGARGMSVVAGHRDTHFRFLQDLRKGQRLLLQLRDGSTRQYRVHDTRVVDSSTHTMLASWSREQLVLVTCYPFDAIDTGGPLRYLVIAEPESGPGELSLPVFQGSVRRHI